jgi:zinc protease
MTCLVRLSILILCVCHTIQADDTKPYHLLSVTPILQALELRHYQLSNGLQIAIVEDATRPVVTCQIYYSVGSADEPPKRQGLAHLVEHLLHDSGFTDQLNLQGGQHSNASTSQDGTRYYVTIPNYLLTQVLEHFARDLVVFDVTQEAFDIEKNVVLAEANSRYNKSAQVVNLQMAKHVFAGHPYQYPVIGTHRDSIRAFTLEMARQFHQQYYVPNNACLVVVGDVSASLVMDDVVTFFGKLGIIGVGSRAVRLYYLPSR